MRNATASQPPSFALLVQQFFTEYLVAQRAVSPRTVACYRDALKLFLDFAGHRLRVAPTALQLSHITPELILAFLDHLEHARHNAVRSRNLRLTALRTFLKYAGRRDIASLHAVERALAVPMKRFERPMLGFLTREEMMAVLGQPGPSWTSQRDHLLLTMLYNTGARVSDHRRACDRRGPRSRRLRASARQGTQAAVDPFVESNRAGAARLAASQSPPARRGRSAAEPQWRPDDQIERSSAPGVSGQASAGPASGPEEEARLAAPASTHDRDALIAVRRPLQRDRALARPRKHDYDSSLRRGESGDEGKSPGPAGGT